MTTTEKIITRINKAIHNFEKKHSERFLTFVYFGGMVLAVYIFGLLTTIVTNNIHLF